jgi:NAD(P)-dependent dehydrogenase (short-subunit alcohol dehydrogenase family)
MGPNLFDLTGKTALITGASRGIGRATAELLAEQGAHVIISSRRQADCETVADAINAAGGSAEGLACHIGDLGQIEATVAGVRRRHGRLDILVNNAATNPYFGHILDTPPDAFQKTIDVNIRGYFFMSVEAGKLMRETGGGAIVNTASINALKPPPMQAIYSMTKAAVVNMTRAFAKECARFDIRCNALLPGLTRTEFAGALFEDEKFYNHAIAQIPMRRHAEPGEMAGAVLYLVSGASSFTTGEILVVDGGMTI